MKRMNDEQPTSNLPPEITDGEDTDHPLDIEDDPILGPVVINYPSDRLRLLFIGGVVYAISGVILNIAFLPVDAQTASIIVIGLMTVLALVIGWVILHSWNREVVLYERGFSYRQGSQLAHILFNEVRSIHLHAERVAYFGGLIRRTIRRFTLVTIHDETVLIDSRYRRVDDLLSRLERAILPHLRASTDKRLTEGQTVRFGTRVTLWSAGLSVDEHQLLWADYHSYSVQGGQLHIKATANPQAAWASIPLAEIENLTLLVEFLRVHSEDNSKDNAKG